MAEEPEVFEDDVFIAMVAGARNVLDKMYAQREESALSAFIGAWVGWHVDNGREAAIPKVFEHAAKLTKALVELRNFSGALDSVPDGSVH